ncbi:MAG TPA: M48 family metallopeptidase [Kofleriaceae bacterium]|jgi:uncharacterized tellurite resistance protein B-like protein
MRTGLRSQGDIELAALLAKEPEIVEYGRQRSRDKLDDTRRHLLGSAVRLTRAIAPEMHEVVAHCAKTLGVTGETEVYVSPSPFFNAFCYPASNNRIFVGVTSSLFEAFDSKELSFVVGHELGHFLCSHLDLPAGSQLQQVTTSLALSLTSWRRMAEISADRAGLECVRDVTVAARTFLKLSSGLARTNVKLDVDEYLRQLADLKAESEIAGDKDEIRDEWLSTHPLSPLRVRAVQLAWESELFTPGGTKVDLLEHEVTSLMSIMEPNYASDKTTAGEAMRRVLLAAGVAIAGADGTIDENELTALQRFLGEPPASVNATALRGDLPRRLAFAKVQVQGNKRYQLVRDLCVIAYADHSISASENELLHEVADGLGVDGAFVDMSLKSIARGLD